MEASCGISGSSGLFRSVKAADMLSAKLAVKVLVFGMPVHSNETRGVVTAYFAILKVLGVRADAQVVTLIVEGVPVLVIHLGSGADAEKYSVHRESCVPLIGWSIFTSGRVKQIPLFVCVPFPLRQEFVIFVVHKCH